MINVSDVTIDEICVIAIAEAFRGDGEILCNPIGVVPVCGGRLARESFEPDLMMTDTVSVLVANTLPIGVAYAEKVVESNMPFRSIFDVVWSGRRGADAWYTTVTVQRAAGPAAAGGLSLDETLKAAYASVTDAPGFAWDWIEPTSVGGVAAVRYAVTFELHEAKRRKLGVMLATSAGAVDVAYGASDERFAAGLPVFEGVVASIWIDPTRRAGRETASAGMVGSAP